MARERLLRRKLCRQPGNGSELDITLATQKATVPPHHSRHHAVPHISLLLSPKLKSHLPSPFGLQAVSRAVFTLKLSEEQRGINVRRGPEEVLARHKPKEMGEVYSALRQDVPARLAEAERVGYGFVLPKELVPNVPGKSCRKPSRRVPVTSIALNLARFHRNTSIVFPRIYQPECRRFRAVLRDLTRQIHRRCGLLIFGCLAFLFCAASAKQRETAKNSQEPANRPRFVHGRLSRQVSEARGRREVGRISEWCR